MIKIKKSNEIFTNKIDPKRKISQSHHKQTNLTKSIIPKVTLKLNSYQSEMYNSVRSKYKSRSKSNLCQQLHHNPKQFISTKSNNIKTFVRFRPLSKIQTSISQNLIENFTFPINNYTSVFIKDTLFTFDRVFRPDQSQDKIFMQTAKDMIEKVLDGYNSTLFVYGQTGSGKTFTMFGDYRKGIIPLSAKQLFMRVNINQSKIDCSILQIYKQTLIDLLEPQKLDLKIKQTVNGIQVIDLTKKQVKSEEQLLQVIAKANQIKKIRQTSINQYSSRSHFILLLTIQQKGDNNQLTKSKLNLIDLAGSQKINKTKVNGQGLEEAKKINLSLSCLSNTINALVKGSQHIPFRQSKLTRILQQSLVGNCSTYLIVTCSIHISCYEQTLSSLKFANRTKKIKTNISKNIIKQQQNIKRQVYESLRNDCENYEQKLQKVKEIIEQSKKLHEPYQDKVLNQISNVVDNIKSQYFFSTQKKNLNNTTEFTSAKIKQQNTQINRLNSQLITFQIKYENSCKQIDICKNIINQKQRIIDEQIKRIKFQQSQINNLQKQLRQRLQLSQLNKKQYELLNKQKQSYHIFQKQVLQNQIINLMQNFYPDKKLQKLQMNKKLIINKFRNEYIDILERSLNNYLNILKKQQNNKQNYSKQQQQQISQIELNIDNDFLPLTYQTAINELKKRNQLILNLIKQNKHVLVTQNQNLKNQINQYKYQLQLINIQLNLIKQKHKLSQNYYAQLKNLQSTIHQQINIGHYQF